MLLSVISWKKNCSESDSSDIVPLCRHRYSCAAESSYSQLITLYGYTDVYSRHCWCELLLRAAVVRLSAHVTVVDDSSVKHVRVKISCEPAHGPGLHDLLGETLT